MTRPDAPGRRGRPGLGAEATEGDATGHGALTPWALPPELEAGQGSIAEALREVEVVARLLGRCTFPPAGTPLRCAVSGGADSTALLVLAVAAGCGATAVHVDHGLRPGSDGEAHAVAALAAALGAGFEGRAVAVAEGPNLEARARRARYRVLGADVATGHTADDRAETVVLNLLRGAGLDGLSALRDRPGAVRRPLLGLRRRDTWALCEQLSIPVVVDPSNADPRFRRNRVRREVLPLLDEVAGRDVAPIVARQADLLADDADLLDALAAELDATDARALAVAPAPLARRAVRRWILAATAPASPVTASPAPALAGAPSAPDVDPDPGDLDRTDRHPVDAAAVARVLAVARGEAVATEVAGGWRVGRTRQRLWIEPPRPDPRRT